MNKYPEDKRFGEWTPEQQREFKIEVLVDGKQWQSAWNLCRGFCAPVTDQLPSFYDDVYYRLAPAEIPDSIDWSHVHPDFTVMSRDDDGEYRGHAALWGVNVPSYPAKAFASYKRGNMESCVVYRPGFEPKDQI